MANSKCIADFQSFYSELVHIVTVKYRTMVLDSEAATQDYYIRMLTDINELSERVNDYPIRLADDDYAPFIKWLKVQLVVHIEKKRNEINKKYVKFLNSTVEYNVPKQTKKQNSNNNN